jgi:hypothetical protein
VVESQLESSGLLTFIFLTPRAEAVVTFRVALHCGAIQFPTPIEADSIRRAGATGYAEMQQSVGGEASARCEVDGQGNRR